MQKLSADFLNQVSYLLENARKSIKTAVNLSMVYTYICILIRKIWKRFFCYKFKTNAAVLHDLFM